jgi:hypothetical protein
MFGRALAILSSVICAPCVVVQNVSAPALQRIDRNDLRVTNGEDPPMPYGAKA